MAYTRTRLFHGVTIPSATRVHVFTCGSPECKSAHLIGFDEEHEPLFEIVVSEKVSEDITRIIKEQK
jgi:hypothetical protein